MSAKQRPQRRPGSASRFALRDHSPQAPARPRIVAAEPAHLEAIAAIYADAVRSSAATFDLEPPGLDHWAAVLAGADPSTGHLLLVAVGEQGEVLGYAKSGRFKDRGAYATTCETSVYIAASGRGRGVGRALYAELFELLDASQLRLAVAGVAEPNPASTALHLRFGFERVGTFEGVGVKFGRPWDVTWYQRRLAGG
jgi:L-amino acid N-acyltransferase YncA